MTKPIMNLLIAGILTIFITSCGTSKKTASEDDDIVYNTLPEMVMSASREFIIHRQKPKIWDLIHTQLDIKPLPLVNLMEGEALIWLKPHLYPQDTLVLDAKYITVNEVSFCVNNIEHVFQKPLRSSVVSNFIKTPLKLIIPLNKTYTSSDTICVQISYKVTPDSVKSGGSASIRERKGIYMLHPDKYHPNRPLQVWTQGEPESASFWFPTLDAPNQKSTHVIAVENDYGLISLSNGLKIDSAQDGLWRRDVWSTKLPISPYLFMLGLSNYYVAMEKSRNGIDLMYMVDSSHANIAKEIFNHTPEMIDFFSDITGVPYPWEKYAQAIVHDFVSGAMENTSAVTFGEFVQKNQRELYDDNNDDIVAHELFHHWFGDLVTFESWTHISMSESFATLGDILWHGEKYGSIREQKSRYKAFETYLKSSDYNESSLYRYYYSKPGDVFDRISYQKGACLLFMLRDQIGENAFNMAMKEYLSSHAFGSAEITDWRLALEKVTGLDMEAFFEQWYETPYIPTLLMEVRRDSALRLNKLIVSYRDSSRKYNLNTSITCYSKDSSWTLPVEFRDSIYEWEFEDVAGQEVIPVFDGKHTLLAAIKRQAPASYWKNLLLRSNHYEDLGLALANLENDIGDFDIQNKLYAMIMSDEPVYQTLASSYVDPKKQSLEADAKIRQYMMNPEKDAKARSLLVDVYAQPTKTSDSSWLKKLLKDPSYQVCARSLYRIDSIDHEYAINYAHDSVTTSKGDLYRAIMYILANQKNGESMSYLKNELKTTYGGSSFTPVLYMSEFAKNTSEDEVYFEAADLLTEKIVHDDLVRLQDYAISKLYNMYIDAYKKENSERADYIKKCFNERIYPSISDSNRAENMREQYNWTVKIDD